MPASRLWKSHGATRMAIPRFNFVQITNGHMTMPARMRAMEFKLGDDHVRSTARRTKSCAEFFYVRVKGREKAVLDAASTHSIDSPVPISTEL